MLLIELIPDWAYGIYKNSKSDLSFDDFKFSAILYEENEVNCNGRLFGLASTSIKRISITFKEFLEKYILRFPNDIILDNKTIHIQFKKYKCYYLN